MVESEPKVARASAASEPGESSLQLGSRAKAILDLAKTLEVLETIGVPVVGYETDEPPAFYSRRSGLRLEARDVDLVALDEALTLLAALDDRQSRIVELRFFGGLTTEDVAEVLDVSPATVHREWCMAKAWLRHQISKG